MLLASQLIALYRVDRTWTKQHLLPLFNWDYPVEATAVWQGFLWSPRLYQPVLAALKFQFLDCANHYNELGEQRQQFAAFMTYAALSNIEDYTVDDFRCAISKLPQEGLEESAQALYQALEGSADQRENYWANRIQPFWKEVWPKSRDLATQRIAESLSRLAIAAGGEVTQALASVQDWLQPIEHPDHIVHLLSESGLCVKSPADALQLLSAIIDDQQWVPRELDKCLGEIGNASRQLVHDARFKSLQEYRRKRM